MQNCRFFVLSALAADGPQHGHELRRRAADDPTGLTAGLKGGALYGTLARLAREHLIAPVRTERERGYPERVVYSLTEAGRAALEELRAELARIVVVADDPFDLTLLRGAGTSVPELSRVIDGRLVELRARRKAAVNRLVAGAESLTAAEEAAIEHTVARLEADITWHERLHPRVPTIIGEGPW